MKRFKIFDTYFQITFQEDNKIAAVICILQMRKLRFRKINLFAQGHTAGKCQGPIWDGTLFPLRSDVFAVCSL